MKRSRIGLAGLAALMMLALSAPAANAVVVHLSNGRFAGVYLHAGLSAPAYEKKTGARALAPANRVSTAATDPNGLFYQGGPVLHTSSPYLVFWDPNGAITAKSRQVMTQYLTDAGLDSHNASDVYDYRILSQYTDSNGSAAQGQTFSAGTQAISDTQAYPSVDTSTCTSSERSGFAACITDNQIHTELTRLINADGLPSGTGANAPVYFVVTPENVNVCVNGGGGCASDTFCAYHSAYTLSGSTKVVYASIPFTLGTNCQSAGPVEPPVQEPNGDVADVITDNLNHENAEAVTDPLPGGNTTAWVTSNGYEVADQCEAYGPNDPNSTSPDGPTSMDAYMPELGGSQSAGTLYDQLINGNHYFTQTLWSNSADGCAATATISPSFTSSAPIVPNQSASFDPSASTSTDGYSSATWSWGDGSPNTVVAGAPTTASHTYGAPGTYTVTLTLVDAGGNTAQVSHSVLVDSPPSAAFSANPSVVAVGSSVAFNGAASSDPNQGESITGYSWSFGDGSPAGSGVAPSHTYASPGTYTVTLTVTGSDGLTGSVSHTVTVQAAPITASFTSPAPILPGVSASFDPSGSSSNDGYSSTTWSWGDGSPNTFVNGAPTAASHTYAVPGSYTVTLTLVDTGGHTAEVSHTIVVDSPPTAAFSVSPTVVEAGSPVTFNGAASSDPNQGESLTGYSWSFGDSSSSAGASPSHTYASPGTYTVTLTVTGSDGLTATVSHTVTVVAVPVAKPSLATPTPVAGSPVSFDGGSSTGGVTGYAWNFGDGTIGSGSTASHTYTNPGTYTVTLTVTDASGFTSSQSLTVVVAAPGKIKGWSVKHVKGKYYLVVTVTQPGTVRAGSAKATLKRPGKATLKLSLSGAQLHQIARHKTVSKKLTIVYTPALGPQIHRAITVKL